MIHENSEEILFPVIDPFDQGFLDAAEGHRVYYEQCGNPHGAPALFLHGGPGSGCNPRSRRLFDPRLYRVILFDQRGCGRSEPRGAIHHNTTDYLIRDIERLRDHLGIERWFVCGGSWGAALALAYAASHRPRVSGLLLRGAFLTGKSDLQWFFQDAAQLAPDAWSRFAAFAPKRRRRDLLDYYARQLLGEDRERAVQAAHAWACYERALLNPWHGAGQEAIRQEAIETVEAQRLLDKYRLQAHYLVHECFLGERHLLGLTSRLHGLSTAIVHGRLDRVCRPSNSWRLHHALAGSRLMFVDGAGHESFDAPLARAQIEAIRHFAAHQDFAGWGSRAAP